MPPRRSTRSRSNSVSSAASDTSKGSKKKASPTKKRSRWGDSGEAEEPPAAKKMKTEDKAAAIAAKKASVAARLAAAKEKKLAAAKAKAAGGGGAGAMATAMAKKAQVFELDMNDTERKAPPAISSSVAANAERAAEAAKPKPKSSNPYLAHLDEDEDNFQSGWDNSLKTTQRNKRVNKEFKFFEKGQILEKAAIVKAKSAEVYKAGYGSGRKQITKNVAVTKEGAAVVQADVFGGGGGELPPRSDVVGKAPLVMEWWDYDLCPKETLDEVSRAEKARSARIMDSKTKTGSTTFSSEIKLDVNKILKSLDYTQSKTHKLIEHPIPVKPLNWSNKPPAQPTVYLTQKERKRQRRLNRAEKLQDLRDKQALGLVDAPEQKLTLANFMKVMGDSAVMDPSKMEAVVQKQIQARQDKHMADNDSRKLTKEQKEEKKAKKRLEDTSKGLSIAAFFVLDMTHRLHRAKVDLTAQQNNLSGIVLEMKDVGTVLIVEGGSKAIKRFTRLVTHRMKWAGDGDEDSDSEDEEGEGEKNGSQLSKYNPDNYAKVLWSGSALHRKFQGFKFLQSFAEKDAKQILKDYSHLYGEAVATVGGGASGLVSFVGADDVVEEEDAMDES
ncbi:hypothetical protein TrLO_g7903 [Triparma laevis f. longispina]|uniref:Uncharacterized protein n=1 Tax=Triparma laevis f. longispina TaxID=1714387 RepID=A0A9W7FUH2_9STRA|nr:hypothetical protein TrLO_g7903 [Triparma laevis f. longispina]